MAADSCAIDPADLHGLADHQLEDERRAVLVRRLAASPADRKCVEAWQSQNELLRTSFAEVEREPLPAILDLTAKARLQCIPANDAPLVAPQPGARDPVNRPMRLATGLATALVIAAGLGGSWYLLESSRPTASTTPADESSGAPELATTVEPLSEAEENRGLVRLPIAQIPDLHSLGFRFIGAETTSTPPAILFRYEDGPTRLIVKIARVEKSVGVPLPVSKTEAGYEWVARDIKYSVAGSAPQKRLHEVSVALHQDKK